MVGFINTLHCDLCKEKVVGGFSLLPEDADPEEQQVWCNPCWLVSGIEEGK